LVNEGTADVPSPPLGKTASPGGFKVFLISRVRGKRLTQGLLCTLFWSWSAGWVARRLIIAIFILNIFTPRVNPSFYCGNICIFPKDCYGCIDLVVCVTRHKGYEIPGYDRISFDMVGWQLKQWLKSDWTRIQIPVYFAKCFVPSDENCRI